MYFSTSRRRAQALNFGDAEYKSLGLGYRKARGVPAKADPVARQAFHDRTLKLLLARAVAGERTVFFADAAHVVRGAFLADLWCFVRWVVPTGAGRQRSSVLAALDAADRTRVRKATAGNVNAVTAGRLLLRLREAHPRVPITVIWDNARYQHTAMVRAVAAYAKIDPVYRPTYSPNRNRIERIRKFVKQKALANRTHESFADFRAAIDRVLDELGTTHKGEMATLLTYKFETLQPASK